MKQFKIRATAIALFLFMAGANAQTEKTAPWGSEKGYWVVESNKNSPLQHTIRFYNNTDVLVYTETVSNTNLNCEKRKVKMKLKQVLETAVIAWERSQQPSANKDYVAAILK